jgi:PadR family transcriptional regulator, regulatory protein PadR
MMSNYEKYLESAVLELRRGTLALSILSVLNQPMYGYSLIQLLSDEGLNIDQSTLYPLLRRLEKQGILKSSWLLEDNRQRKYYELSEMGSKFREDLIREWKKIIGVMKKLSNNLEEGKQNGFN